MKTIKATHFWSWFRRNQQHFINYEELAPAAKDYWLEELYTHTVACDRHLMPYLACSDDRNNKRCELLITAMGRQQSFRSADRLIAKAPRMATWSFVSLVPPVKLEHGISEELQQAGLTGRSFWFDVRSTLPYRKPSFVIVDTSEGYSPDLEALAEQAVANVLGERLFAERVEYVRMVRLADLLPENLAFLAPLGDLHDFVQARELSGMKVGRDGKLIKYNAP